MSNIIKLPFHYEAKTTHVFNICGQTFVSNGCQTFKYEKREAVYRTFNIPYVLRDLVDQAVKELKGETTVEELILAGVEGYRILDFLPVTAWVGKNLPTTRSKSLTIEEFDNLSKEDRMWCLMNQPITHIEAIAPSVTKEEVIEIIETLEKHDVRFIGFYAIKLAKYHFDAFYETGYNNVLVVLAGSNCSLEDRLKLLRPGELFVPVALGQGDDVLPEELYEYAIEHSSFRDLGKFVNRIPVSLYGKLLKKYEDKLESLVSILGLTALTTMVETIDGFKEELTSDLKYITNNPYSFPISLFNEVVEKHIDEIIEEVSNNNLSCGFLTRVLSDDVSVSKENIWKIYTAPEKLSLGYRDKVDLYELFGQDFIDEEGRRFKENMATQLSADPSLQDGRAVEYDEILEGCEVEHTGSNKDYLNLSLDQLRLKASFNLRDSVLRG